jgi:hypothetical protein
VQAISSCRRLPVSNFLLPSNTCNRIENLTLTASKSNLHNDIAVYNGRSVSGEPGSYSEG